MKFWKRNIKFFVLTAILAIGCNFLFYYLVVRFIVENLL